MNPDETMQAYVGGDVYEGVQSGVEPNKNQDLFRVISSLVSFSAVLGVIHFLCFINLFFLSGEYGYPSIVLLA